MGFPSPLYSHNDSYPPWTLWFLNYTIDPQCTTKMWSQQCWPSGKDEGRLCCVSCVSCSRWVSVRQECASPLAKAIPGQAKLSAVTSPAVDLSIRSVVHCRWVEISITGATGKTPLVPVPSSGHQLLRVKDLVAAPRTPCAFLRWVLKLACPRVEVNQRSWLLVLSRTSRHESRSLPKAVPMGTKVLPIARSAENFTIRGVAACHWV